jgi:hypothetical protein
MLLRRLARAPAAARAALAPPASPARKSTEADAWVGFSAPLPRAAATTPSEDVPDRAARPRAAAAVVARAAVGGSGIDGHRRAWADKPPAFRNATAPSASPSSPPKRGYAAESESSAAATRAEWEKLARSGSVINPCNSPAHPAAVAGVAPPDPHAPAKSIQASYDAHSQCFVCGNAHPNGLGLKSYREEDPDALARCPSALRSVAVIGETHVGLPGIVSTGIMDALLICHGSWQAGIAMMDKAVTPRPPLVLPKRFAVEVVDRLPPGATTRIATRRVEMRDDREPFSAVVKMDLEAEVETGERFVCASAEATYEKVGAVRSMW